MNASPVFWSQAARLASFFVFLSLLVSAASLSAQSVRERDREDEEFSSEGTPNVFVLDPFNVTDEHDQGYQAFSTMSGTRLNTRLEDLASSTTVVTRQQLDDTASTDINDIFLYEASTEGIYEFTDFTLDANGNQIDNTGVNPSGANRMRGIGAAQIAIGGFELNSIPISTYNVDAVEINRGPNSSIFGVGDGGGGVNLIAGQASLRKKSSRATVRVDSYGTFSVEGDYHVPLIKDRLGLRLSGQHEEKGFVRKPSFDDTDRWTVSGVYRPFKKTTLRASYESYRNENKRPNSMTPYDFVTPWLEAGSPTWNPITRTLTREDGTVIVSGITYANVNRDLFLPGYGVNADGGFMTRLTQFIDRGELALYMPAIKRNAASSAPASTGGTTNIFYISSGMVFDAARATLWRPQGITDQSMYDWEEINIAGANYAEQEANKIKVDLEQYLIDTQTNRLVFQGSMLRENSETLSRAFVGSTNGVPSALRIDVNEKLLDGEDNPFFMRSFLSGSLPETRWRPDRSETFRGQLAYQFDLTKHKNRWVRLLLGRQNFLAYGETRERFAGNLGFHDFVTSVHDWLPEFTGSGAPRTKVADNYRHNYRYYMGGGSGQYGITYAPEANNPSGLRELYWYRGTTDEWLTEEVLFEPLHRSGRMNRNNRYTMGGVWHASLFNDKILPTLGWREDRTRSYDGPARIANDGVTGYPDLDIMWDFNDPTRDYVKAYRTGRTEQRGVVVKPLKWFHMHYNESDSFRPASVAYNALFETLPNPQSEGKDYGFTLQLFDRKLTVKFNQYETVQRYSRTSSGGTNTSRILRMDFNIQRGDRDSLPGRRDSFNLEGAAWYWVLSDEQITPAEAAAINSAGLAGDTAAAAQMEGLRRKVWDYIGLDFDNYWLQYMTAPGSLGLTDSSVHNARGRELEISYNPNRYFTMKGSVVNRKAYDTDLSVANSTYVEQRWEHWNTVRIPSNFRVWDDASGTWQVAGSSGGTAAWDRHGAAGDLWWDTDYRLQPNSGVSNPNTTPGRWYMQNVNAPHQLAIARSGQMKSQLSEWSAKFTANYRLAGMGFTNFLKNASVGGSARLADKQIIGYLAADPVFDPVSNTDIYMTYDPSRPIYNDPDTQVDLWMNYTVKGIFRDKVDLKVQLNIRNAFEGGGLRGVSVNPDGEYRNFRIIDPRRIILTTTFEF